MVGTLMTIGDLMASAATCIGKASTMELEGDKTIRQAYVAKESMSFIFQRQPNLTKGLETNI